jgi:hypothetical protein
MHKIKIQNTRCSDYQRTSFFLFPLFLPLLLERVGVRSGVRGLAYLIHTLIL